MDRFLLARLDDQLENASGRSRNAFDAPPGPPPLDAQGPSPGGRDGRGPGFLLAPGQNEGTLGAEVVDGEVTQAAVLDRRGDPTSLPTAQYDVLSDVPVDGEPHTRELGADLGEYRLVATETPDGNAIVTGLPLGGVRDTVYQLAAAITIVAVLGLAAAALAGGAIIRLTLRPLPRVAATAARVAGMPLDRGEVALSVRVPDRDADGRTEVGQVGAALNRMLGHVASALAARQHSEATVRHFVADASHELRTPLAAIRGYAEVTRPVRAELPPDVAHALERVELHAVRMTGLVEDLLLLARLDSGRPVEHRDVDLSRLVVEAVNDALVAGPDHRWELVLPDEPVIAIGDAQHLHQVVVNLLANARTHTPPGTRTTVTLRGDSTNAVMTVIDDGPGIPEAVLPDIFERFVRGDSSRSRAAGSGQRAVQDWACRLSLLLSTRTVAQSTSKVGLVTLHSPSGCRSETAPRNSTRCPQPTARRCPHDDRAPHSNPPAGACSCEGRTPLGSTSPRDPLARDRGAVRVGARRSPGGMPADSGSSASQEIAAWVTDNFAATTVDGVTVYDLTS